MIRDFLRREIDAGSFPGAAWAVGTVDGIEHEGAVGNAVVVPMRTPATLDTIWDCASITKPLVTGVVILQLVAEGRIELDGLHRGYTFHELLTHTSGLRAWLPLYAFDDRLAAIEEHGPEARRDTRALYSDLNFVLLHDAIQQVEGDYVDAARRRIFEPLGLRDACFRPAPSLRPRIAATEWGQRFEMKMCADRGIAFNGFREGLIWGETHDGNSHHGGGTLGNAGLFATPREVFRIAQAFARGELADAALAREASRAHVDDRGLAWQTGGPGLSAASWGHTGFTGTSVWIEDERVFVLLTNRVHPCAAPVGMKRIRAEFHRLAGQAASR